jgi:DNA repair protein RadA/Sms
VPLPEVDDHSHGAVPTGVAELDRVLAGGLVPSSVTLVAGEPGIGKSTLLLQVLAAMARSGLRTLLVSGEESKSQVRSRARRLGAEAESLWVVSETCLPDVLAAVAEVEPHVVVVDSIQTLYDPAVESAAGSVAQVRHCAGRLVEAAKRDRVADGPGGMSILLVGHVTKEGAIAGPRVLEHVVDTVLSFEGDRHHGLRLLRAVKHRFGPTGELGLFEMTSAGVVGVEDPSAHLLGDRRPGIPGAVVLPAMEGGRPLLVEVQALVVSDGAGGSPRRSVQGLDAGRLPMLLAVMERRAGLSLARMEVYVSVVGGIRVGEPAADLAVVAALTSASAGVAVPEDTVVFGELGLGGEIRQVAHVQRRLAEARRLGFRHAMVPASVAEAPEGLELVRVATVFDAVAALALP